MGLSARKKLLYALGQFGLVLCAYGVGKLFVSFFVTRGLGAAPVFPAFISQEYLLGFFTITGLIIGFTRLVDAVAGLFAGFTSDRSRLRRGRRTGIMAFSVVPLSMLSVLIFFPPVQGISHLNAVVLFSCLTLFYIFLSLYTVPYLALMAEYGTSPRDRMKLSTLMACATAFASILGDRIEWLMNHLVSLFSLSPLSSFRLIIVAYGVVSCLCMMAPAFLLNEKRHAGAAPVEGPFSAAFAAVLKDTCLKPYLVADAMYRVASAFAIAGFSYYVTVLLGLPRELTLFFLLFIFFANLILYVPAYYIVLRFGKRKSLFAAFVMLIVFLTASVFVGKYPFSPLIQGAILSILVALPASIFTVVPNAIVADLAVAAEKKTGIQRGGMYFGVHSFVTKFAQMVSSLLFPTLISIGSGEDGSGIGRVGLRLTLIIAAVFSFIGFLALFGYREKEVAVLLEKKD